MRGTATLYRIKPGFQAALRPAVARCARAGVRPNHLTLAAIAVSAASGAVVAAGSSRPGLLLVAPMLYLLRMALNAMDGLLAREHHMTSRSGAVLNEIGDVISDAVAYLPFAGLLPGHGWLVVVVVVLGLIGEVAALVNGDESGRRNDGPLGKSDRAVAFGVVALLFACGPRAAVGPVLAFVAVLGLITIWNRATETGA
jgi:CDP-diacylglycerol--glycerol-3-phosphate 3-phosphatidyltransferase